MDGSSFSVWVWTKGPSWGVGGRGLFLLVLGSTGCLVVFSGPETPREP